MLHSRVLLPSLALVTLLCAAGCGESPAETTGSGGSGAGAGGGGAGGEGGAQGGAGGAQGGAGGAGGTTTTPTEPNIGGDRPVKMYIPSSYDGTQPAPLLVLLHGFGASGSLQEIYLGFKTVAEERGFLYAVPDGTANAQGEKFWNATDACCGFGATVDDSAYLSGVVDEIKAAYNVDPKRVYFFGHSNGGFMSYRMACDHADQIAAIVSLAGATFADDSKCNPTSPVAVAQVHGTADDTILYEGGTLGPFEYPSAVATVDTWAAHGGCSLDVKDGGTLDLESSVDGDETTISILENGCQPGGHAELWTIQGGGHIPGFTPAFKASVFDFLEAHPKP